MRVANRLKNKSRAEFERKVLERFSKPGNLYDVKIPPNWSMKDICKILDRHGILHFPASPDSIHTYTH